MSGEQRGHFAPGDLKYEIEHLGLTLAELPDGGVSWDFDPAIEAAGSGLGNLKNSYFKATGAPKGTGKLSQAMLDRADNGYIFLDLVSGAQIVQQESIALASATYTVACATSLTSVLEIRGASGAVLREGHDYTVNYATGVITFAAATGEANVIRYLASARKSANMLINGGFEDSLINIWAIVATAVIVRDTANAYVEGNALKVTPAAVNDGFKYIISTPALVGRTYRLSFWAKAAAAETLLATWNDGTSDIAMTGTCTLGVAYAKFEFTFTATKSPIVNITIKDSKAVPAVFYIDEIQLADATSGSGPTLTTNPLDAGLGQPFTFNLIGRRVVDGVVAHKLLKCAVDKVSAKSGKAYSQDISFQFLDYQGM